MTRSGSAEVPDVLVHGLIIALPPDLFDRGGIA